MQGCTTLLYYKPVVDVESTKPEEQGMLGEGARLEFTGGRA